MSAFLVTIESDNGSEKKSPRFLGVYKAERYIARPCFAFAPHRNRVLSVGRGGSFVGSSFSGLALPAVVKFFTPCSQSQLQLLS